MGGNCFTKSGYRDANGKYSINWMNRRGTALYCKEGVKKFLKQHLVLEKQRLKDENTKVFKDYWKVYVNKVDIQNHSSNCRTKRQCRTRNGHISCPLSRISTTDQYEFGFLKADEELCKMIHEE